MSSSLSAIAAFVTLCPWGPPTPGSVTWRQLCTRKLKVQGILAKSSHWENNIWISKKKPSALTWLATVFGIKSSLAMANLFIGADLETFCNYWNLSEKMLMTSVNFRDSSHVLYIRIHIALLLFNRIGLTSQRCIWICYVDSLTRQALINRVSKSDTEKNSANNTRVNSKYQFVENPRDCCFFWQLFIPYKLHTVD